MAIHYKSLFTCLDNCPLHTGEIHLRFNYGKSQNQEFLMENNLFKKKKERKEKCAFHPPWVAFLGLQYMQGGYCH